MKNLALTLLAALALGACTRADDTPAPARLTRQPQNLVITYSLTPSTLANDTVLVNPRLRVFVLPAGFKDDGTFSYAATSGTGAITPVADITSFSTTTPISVAAPAGVLTDGSPSTGIRVLLTTTNRPGRRTGSQALQAVVSVGGVTRSTVRHNGLGFSRTATASGGVFSTIFDTNFAAY